MRGGALLVAVALALVACEPGSGRGAVQDGRAPGRPSVGVPEDTTFGGLVVGLSEPGGYFDTDNLISNESSYLHVLGGLDSAGVRGGAYVGVGPDQNFSYMAAIRPTVAFIVDIRRDNMLQQLWFRALFEASESRLDYLCVMVARACGGDSRTMDVATLVARVDGAPPVEDAGSLMDGVTERAASFGVPLEPGDLQAIRAIHERFAAAGLALRFNTHGRAPRPYYPTLRGLILERDRRGTAGSYLADEEAYRYVRAMQAEGRVIPVVGDLAGPHAIRAIGEVLRDRGERLSAYYVSNVEFYLFGDGTFPAFIENLAALPLAEHAVLIRSVFRGAGALPGFVPGYGSTQMLHGAPALLRAWEQGRIRSYAGLVAAGFSD